MQIRVVAGQKRLTKLGPSRGLHRKFPRTHPMKARPFFPAPIHPHALHHHRVGKSLTAIDSRAEKRVLIVSLLRASVAANHVARPHSDAGQLGMVKEGKS